MPSLLTHAKGVVEDLASLEEDADKDTLEANSAIVAEVDQLSKMTKSELACTDHLSKD